MERIKKYIRMLDEEIEALIGDECDAGECTHDLESDLHILFENRKHAIEYLKGKEARREG